MSEIRLVDLPESNSIQGDNYNFIVNDNGSAKQVDKETLKSYLKLATSYTWNEIVNIT